MIKFENLKENKPLQIFKNLYEEALYKNQKNADAACISSYNPKSNEVSSRFVNIKKVNSNNFYFFTNYSSPKSIDFELSKKVSMVFFWNATEIQIRFKGMIKKITEKESDMHFASRKKEKNILAIISNQSSEINSYQEFLKKYNEAFSSLKNKNLNRPSYWGGYAIEPYQIEFWKGNPNRLNERTLYEKSASGTWSSPIYLEP